MDLSERFYDALVYATRLHAAQRRKISGAPYAAHLLRVAGVVLEHATHEDEVIAALLHDAVEDQGGGAARKAIWERFGEQVAKIVEGCTDTDQTPKPPWRERKQAYLTRLASAPLSVRLVAAADKLDNARSLLSAYRATGDAVWQHFHGGRDGTLWYLHAVVDVLKRSERHALFEELERTVAELVSLVLPASSIEAKPTGANPRADSACD